MHPFTRSLVVIAAILWVYIWWSLEISVKGVVIKEHHTFWFKSR